MKNGKVILIITMFVIIIRVINAQSVGVDIVDFSYNSPYPDQGYGVQGQNYTLVQNCENATYITLTGFQYPNKSFHMINENMSDTVNGTFTYNFTQTQEIGRYNFYGYSDGCRFGFVFEINIRNNGYDLSEAEAKVYLLLFISFLIMFCLSLAIAIFTPFSNKTVKEKGYIAVIKITWSKYLKIFGVWLTYASYFAILTLLTGLTQNYVNFVEMRDLMTNIYTFSFVGWYVLTVTITWITFALVWKDILYRKEIIEGGRSFIKQFEK